MVDRGIRKDALTAFVSSITVSYRFDQDGNQYDGLGYRYHLDASDRKVRNRLYQVRELADMGDLYANDVKDLPYLNENIQDPTGQGDPSLGLNINQLNNYSYDELGNLIKDRNEGIDAIEWTVTGKVRSVERTTASGKQGLRFTYGADGQRITKEVTDQAGEPLYRVHHVRDAQGNIMATYRHQVATGSLKLTERPIYGSARLGVDAHALELGGLGFEDPNPYLLDNPIGKVNYELTDHLGNVTTVITDELIGVDIQDNASAFEYFQPFVLSATRYEAFGSPLPNGLWDHKQGAPTLRLLRMLESGESIEIDLDGTPISIPFNLAYSTIEEYLEEIRDALLLNSVTATVVDDALQVANWPNNSTISGTLGIIIMESGSYARSFNGKEDDHELGDWQDYGMRMSMKRIGRFPSVDPLASQFPWYTPYQFAGNNPIWATDLDGLEECIEVYMYDENGTVTKIERWTAKDVEKHGPLGNGTYAIHMYPDGTFCESYQPGEGNSMPAFSECNIKQATWVGENRQRFKGMEDRLNARLIEGVVENSMIAQGQDETSVRRNVLVHDSNDPRFKGKFATFAEGTVDQHTEGWDPAAVSKNHDSLTGKTSKVIGDTDVKIKYYDGAASTTDAVQNQIGFVREGWFDHRYEAARATLDSSVNLGVENAKIVKQSMDKAD
jgi:RHS repeat-associated protein